jgi:hypothetical protein
VEEGAREKAGNDEIDALLKGRDGEGSGGGAGPAGGGAWRRKGGAGRVRPVAQRRVGPGTDRGAPVTEAGGSRDREAVSLTGGPRGYSTRWWHSNLFQIQTSSKPI